MIKIFIILITNLIFSFQFTIKNDFGTIIFNNFNYENPFLGGFNKPKIQWFDWNNDGFKDLFLLDEDGCIRYFLNENENFVLQTTKFQNLSSLSWFYIYDFDNDLQNEIITSSNFYAGGVSYYDYIDGAIEYVSEITNENNNYLDIDLSMVPTFSDIDGDEDLDLFSGNIIGTLNFFENKGLYNNIPVFNLETNYWQEIYIVGQSRHGASAISFIDLDNDLDLDLSWGDYFQQSLYIVWNIGDVLNPIMDNDNIITQFPFQNPVNTAGLNLPSFVDIDNDSDNDLFVTTLSGAYGYQLTNNFIHYENIDNNYILRTNNYIETVDHLSDINPKMIDIDSDGDLDLFVGTNYDPSSFPWIGKIIYYENIGDDLDSQPIWDNQNNNDFLNVDLGNNLFPEFIDIDNDNDFDLFVGNYNGVIHYFKNTGTIYEYNFEYIGILNDIDLQGYSSPEFIDIDSDGDYDLLTGSLNGNIYLYENIGDEYNFDFNFQSDAFNDINVGNRSNILSIDIDLDKDYDLFIGSGNTNIYFYENVGNEYSAEYQLNNNFILPYFGKNVSIDYYSSCDYTGIVAGISTGGMYFASLNNNIIGDVNNDNIQNIFDIIILIESILNSSYNELVDINSDCMINISDVVILVNMILGT